MMYKNKIKHYSVFVVLDLVLLVAFLIFKVPYVYVVPCVWVFCDLFCLASFLFRCKNGGGETDVPMP